MLSKKYREEIELEIVVHVADGTVYSYGIQSKSISEAVTKNHNQIRIWHHTYLLFFIFCVL